MEKSNYYIASFSGGKDSTAMVLHEPLDEVIFCDTYMEFPAMYKHIEKVRKIVEGKNIRGRAFFNELREVVKNA